MVQEYDPEDSPYSFGTTPIYNTLFKTLTSDSDTTDVITINVSTIARNVSGKVNMQQEYKEATTQHFPFDTVAKNIATDTVKEVKLLISDLVQMLNEHRSPLPKYIILYLADYSKIIPSTHYRTPPTSKLHISMAEDRLRDLYKQGRAQSNTNGVHVIEIYNYGRMAPYHLLDREIRSIHNRHHTIMITNHPLDYHLCHTVDKWSDVKSYTGEMQSKDALATKIFGSASLPFTEKLHILLGDKVDMKPSLSSAEKTKLLKVAEQESWYLKSADYTDRRLNQLNYIPPYII